MVNICSKFDDTNERGTDKRNFPSMQHLMDELISRSLMANMTPKTITQVSVLDLLVQEAGVM